MPSSSLRSVRSTNETLHTLKSCLKDPTRMGKTLSQEYNLKRVIFDDVEVREYPQILGDNPAVSEGVPLTIMWNYQNRYNMSVDLFEATRKPLRRNGRKNLLLSPMWRLQTLVAAGYTFQVIGEKIVEVDQARALRLESVADAGWNGPIDVLSERFQTTGAAIIKVGKRGSRILLGPLTAPFRGLKIKQPKQKSITNPAC